MDQFLLFRSYSKEGELNLFLGLLSAQMAMKVNRTPRTNYTPHIKMLPTPPALLRILSTGNKTTILL